MDQHHATIEMSRKGPLLIEGPIGPGPEHENRESHKPHTGPAIVILGHYKVPDYSKTRLQLEGAVDNKSDEVRGKSVAVQTEENLQEREIFWNALVEVLHGNLSSRNFISLGRHCWILLQFMAQENFDIKVESLSNLHFYFKKIYLKF